MQPPSNEVESVSEFTARVKYVLEKQIRASWVRGEISNLRRQASGHVYFSVKDAGSQVSAVMFRGDALKQRVDLRDGMQVVVFGEISVYPPRGNYQLIIRMVVEDGVGRLQQEFERLKAKLGAEGLFDSERKKTIPRLPQVVGLITSGSGAALQDMLRILRRREWRGRVVVLPTRVQGEGAAKEMISQLKLAEALKEFDLLVIGRGGGSLEDLWCFNDESLIRAMADCPIPIISAVGHEIDFTLSDFVADLRAETPSGAAEIISSYFVELLEEYQNLAERLEGAMDWEFSSRQEKLDTLSHRFTLLHPRKRLEQAYQRLDDVSARLQGLGRGVTSKYRRDLLEVMRRFDQLHPEQAIKLSCLELKSLEEKFHWLCLRLVEKAHDKVERLDSALSSLSPEHTLRRGYVMLQDAESNEYISKKEAVHSGQRIRARFADGEIDLHS